MSEGLFDFGADIQRRVDDTPAPARDEQVAAIRRGLDAAGLLSQDDRREYVESVILSDVKSLRDLSALQARRVIERLKAHRGSTETTDGSAWDDRDHDTWIDRM